MTLIKKNNKDWNSNNTNKIKLHLGLPAMTKSSWINYVSNLYEIILVKNVKDSDTYKLYNHIVKELDIKTL